MVGPAELLFRRNHLAVSALNTPIGVLSATASKATGP
jgi:hypothetical protein